MPWQVCGNLCDRHKARWCSCRLVAGEQMPNLQQPGRCAQRKERCPEQQPPLWQEPFQRLCLEIGLLESRFRPPVLGYVTGHVTNPSHPSSRWALYSRRKHILQSLTCHHMWLAPQRRTTVAMSWFCQWHAGAGRILLSPQTLHFVTSLGQAGSQIH